MREVALQPSPRLPADGVAAKSSPRIRRRTPSLAEVIIGASLTAALYASLFALAPGLDMPVHIFMISSLSIASITAFVARITFDRKFNVFEISMLLAYLLSFIAYLNDHDDYVLFYTVTSLVTVGCCAIIARGVSRRMILNAAIAAYCLMIATIFAFYFDEILRALNAHSANRWMIRIFPFGNPPDLVGFIFGAGAIPLFYKALDAKAYAKTLFGFASLLSIALVLAASARSSLLALGAAAALTVLIQFPRMSPRGRLGVTSASAALLILGVVFAGAIVAYLNVILELDSSTRGLGSGGTGRMDVWSQGLNLITSNNIQMLIGGGLRWASVENIGFSTEDSYITIVIESGVLVGLLLIFAIYRAVLGSCILVTEQAAMPERHERAACMAILLFAVIESFFNRYLLGIGNPLSLLLVLLFLSYSFIGRQPRYMPSAAA